MKKKFYDVGLFIYLRSHKRGLETAAIIGIAAAGASAVAGTTSAISNKKAADAANAANLELNKMALEQQERLFNEGNKFNANESALAREFNSQEAQINRDWQAQQLKDNIAWYEKYNSPSAQYQRYIDAGLNPSTLSGNLGTSPSFSVGSGAAATSSPSSAASAPSVPMTHVNPAPLDISSVLGKAFNDASGIIGAMSQKQDYDTKVTFNKYYDEAQKAGLDISRNEARRLWKQGNLIDEQTGYFRENINKIISDIGLQEKQGKLYDKQGNLLDEQTISQNIENLWKNEDFQLSMHLKASELHLSREQERWCSALLKASLAEKLGLAANANAQAELAAATSDLRGEEKNVAKSYKEYLDSGASLNNLELSIFNTPDMKDKRREFEKNKWKLDVEQKEFENSFWMKSARWLNQVSLPFTTAVGMMMLVRGKNSNGLKPIKPSGNIGFTP